ncbi:thiopeptide-type bacteriocin biosynthesis protein [uncultured Williamsia sp.]|uniref:thiopeptide-type bacteriocin biosynthesis protein n=1 Tax=uncultured Williamsia sp. TaxID=259311 RepID=UPI0026299192|nr:thiopeptide-type bacteriocin biosynthesis protein [uncultured Williamsia sp.]
MTSDRHRPPIVPRVAVRAAVLPVSTYPGDVGADGDDTDAVIADIRRLWAQPGVPAAIEVASEPLAAACRAIVSGDERDRKRCRRARRSLVSYRIRAATRATPFGVFAGVGMTDLTDRGRSTGDLGTTVLDVPASRAIIRPSSATRRAALEATLADEDTAFVVNPSVTRRDDRLAVRLPRSGSRSSVTVRATPPVSVVVDAAEKPRCRGDLVREVAVAFPDVDETIVDRFVTELVDTEILVPAHGLSSYDVPAVGDRPCDATLRLPLGAATAEIRRRRATSGSADARNVALCDTEIGLRGALPRQLVDAAPDVLDTLLRVSIVPSAFAAVTDHTVRFAERFGRAVVPLSVVADPYEGIGIPSADRAPAPVDEELSRRRTDLRAMLIERARRSGTSSIAITDDDVADLPPAGEVVASYDMFLQLESRDGTTVPVLSPVSTNFPGGRAMGRFTTTVTGALDHVRDLAADEIAAYAELGDPPVMAEIDHVHGRDAINDVGAARPVHDAVLGTNVPAAEGRRALSLDDVHVALDGSDLRLVLADGTPLEFRQVSMVAPESRPDLVRMLDDLTWDGSARPFFSWGTVEDTTAWLPEVTRSGVVVARQRWRHVGPPRPSADDVARWCADAGVARHVYCGTFDNKLLLDTTNPVHRELIAERLAAGDTWLQAAPTPEDAAVLPDTAGARHAAEVVVTVRTTPSRGATVCRDPLYDDAVSSRRRITIGGEWLYLAVATDLDHQPAVLAAVADAVGDTPWYFVRYHDGAGNDRLRLRVRAWVGDCRPLFTALDDLRSRGLVGDVTAPTHHLEFERYGGPSSTDVHQQAFCRETRALLPVLDRLRAEPTDAVIRADLPTPAAMVVRWLTSVCDDRDHAHAVLAVGVDGYEHELGDRVHRIRKAVRSVGHLDPDVDDEHVVAIGSALTEFWDHHRQSGEVATGPEVLQSALHLFCNRLGLTRSDEYAALLMCRDRFRRDEREATTDR